MKHLVAGALALGLSLAQIAAAAPPPPVPVDRDSDGLIDVNSLEDLDEMRNDLAGTSLRGNTVGCPSAGCRGYELTRNLDFDTDGDGISDWNGGAAWVPVGTTDAPFTGEFNANGHSIRHLRLAALDGVTAYGLFGVAFGATFTAVRIEKPEALVVPADRVATLGALAGRVSHGYARFVYVTGARLGTNTVTQAGGLFGRVDHSFLLELSFSGELDIFTQNGANNTASAGGIAGRAAWTQIANASAKGRISAPRVGGLVETGSNVGISRSFVNAELIALNSAGGLVGSAVYDKSDAALATDSSYHSINTSYAMGTIATGSNLGGGLVRYATSSDGASGRVSNSYARMSIRNTATNTSWANVVQRADAGAITLSSSYWVTNPYGSTLTQRFGNVDAPGYPLQAMQCAAAPPIGGCAHPDIFSSWGSSWDYGTTAQMPALRLNPVYPWISSDTPNGNGDYETIAEIFAKYPTKSCAAPWYFSAKVKNSPYLFTSTSMLQSYEVLKTFNPREGLSCKNADQPDGACMDYEVSYLCDATQAYGGVYWTPYTDVDNPTSGTGDDEPLPPGQLCPAGGPIAIKALVPNMLGRSGPPQKLRTFSATEGLRCVHADGATCKDYEVQFQCGDVISDR